jgi:hypothetical protein
VTTLFKFFFLNFRKTRTKSIEKTNKRNQRSTRKEKRHSEQAQILLDCLAYVPLSHIYFLFIHEILFHPIVNPIKPFFLKFLTLALELNYSLQYLFFIQKINMYAIFEF